MSDFDFSQYPEAETESTNENFDFNQYEALPQTPEPRKKTLDEIMAEGMQQMLRNLAIGTSRTGGHVVKGAFGSESPGARLSDKLLSAISPELAERTRKYNEYYDPAKVFPSEEQYNQFLGVPKEKQTWVDRATQAAPGLAGAFAAGPVGAGEYGVSKIPYIGKALEQGFSYGAPQAAYFAGVSPPGEKLKDALMAGTLGTTIPMAITGGKNLVNAGINAGKEFLSPGSPSNILRAVEGTPYAENVQAGRNIGVHLTPAESSGNKIAAQIQGKTGITTAGSKLHEARQIARLESERKAIESLANDIAPSTKNAPFEVRKAARDELKALKTEREKAAAAQYEKAHSEKVPQTWITSLEKKDANIKNAIDDVLKNESYQVEDELLNVPRNSVKVLDYAKRNIDAQIKAAKKAGNDDLARVLTASKNTLLNKIDDFNETYKGARKAYAEKSPPIDTFMENELGRISKLKNTQLKNLSNQIFDPAQTDLTVIENIRDTIQKHNPEAWNKIVRYGMEKALGKKADVTGTTFYNTIIANPQKFNQFLTALKGNPKAIQKLMDMQKAFKNLIGPEGVKGVAKLSGNFTLDPRSAPQWFQQALIKKFGEKFDKEAVELMTSPDWYEALQKMKTKP